MSFLSILGKVVGDALGALPLIESAINDVEALFGSGNGSAKLAAATGAVLSTLQIYAETTGKTLPANFQSDLQAAINAVVQVKNDLGELLAHTTTTATAGKG